jgi:nanoRNase/pAp phosphatase (c-di-AMP/oligoRNAs hydrolase)
MDKPKLKHFIEQLKPFERIVIQAHDFPDHDAVSAAYGLSIILQHYGMRTLIVYNGDIDRISLSNMIEFVNIPIFHCNQAGLKPDDKVITVDGCIGEKNVTDILGEEIAVIDHHDVVAPADLWFCDIRPKYGATATIIFEYFQLLNIDMPSNVASALLVGLNIDTANLTRGFCNADLTAFLAFNKIADLELVNRICRNSLIETELISFQHIFDELKSGAGIATVLLEKPCAKNLLGVMADFLLSVNEYDVVVVAMNYNNGIQLSLRSECPLVDVGRLLRDTLNNEKMGFGGGHSHMAGGFILQDKVHHFVNSKDAHFEPFTRAISALRSK